MNPSSGGRVRPGREGATASTERRRVRPPSEQYLTAIYVLEAAGTEVIRARLAERVGHSAATTSEIVHRLEEEGYVIAKGRALSLTPAGRELAENVLRKHCLAARLLADVLGLPWHLVHAEAVRWEHVISDDVAARLAEVLGHPTTCPHGCPIPGMCGQLGPTSVLADVEAGQRVCLTRLTDPATFGVEALAYLELCKFLPGSEATVTAKGPDGSLLLSVDDHRVVIGAPMARNLEVRLAH